MQGQRHSQRLLFYELEATGNKYFYEKKQLQ